MIRYCFVLFFISCTLTPNGSNWKNKPLPLHNVPDGKERSQYEATSGKFMISTQGEATTKASLDIIKAGGNLADAAVVASFMISVERPHSTGIGGGGFLIAHHGKSKKVESWDFREMAPASAHRKMFLNADGTQNLDLSLTGSLSVGVPGLVAGLWEFHQKHGFLPWSQVVAPAIELARDGFVIYPSLHRALQAEAPRLCRFEETKKIFMKKDCTPWKMGEILKQADLAKTLSLIASMGKNGFYQGVVAKNIAETTKKYSTIQTLTLADLKNYVVKQRDPVRGEFRGHAIYSMGPPSSGGIHVIQILNILENFDLKKLGPTHPDSLHTIATAMQLAFADRGEHLGDSDFTTFPQDKLVSKTYAKKLAASIPQQQALKSKDLNEINLKKINEPDHTTHFTMMDNEGNMIASTQTINGWFGSAMVAKETGIILNNEMDDFASHVGGSNLFGAFGGKNNLVEPKKRPLSSMSPTIVLDPQGEPLMALGSPSGTRILTCVMQTIFNYVEYDLPLWESVAMTRLHHQWYPEEIKIGPPFFDEAVMKKLESFGHQLKRQSLGCSIQAITREKRGEEFILHGVSDPRGEGMSIGI